MSAIRRRCRSSSLKGVLRKVRTSSVASSTPCCRAPTATTFASLCWRASSAVSLFHTRAARTPGTLFAAICSPLPEPPMTTPSEPGSATVRSPTSKQYGGESSCASYSKAPPAHGSVTGVGQYPQQVVLELEPGVVGADEDAHDGESVRLAAWRSWVSTAGADGGW